MPTERRLPLPRNCRNKDVNYNETSLAAAAAATTTNRPQSTTTTNTNSGSPEKKKPKTSKWDPKYNEKRYPKAERIQSIAMLKFDEQFGGRRRPEETGNNKDDANDNDDNTTFPKIIAIPQGFRVKFGGKGPSNVSESFFLEQIQYFNHEVLDFCVMSGDQVYDDDADGAEPSEENQHRRLRLLVHRYESFFCGPRQGRTRVLQQQKRARRTMLLSKIGQRMAGDGGQVHLPVKLVIFDETDTTWKDLYDMLWNQQREFLRSERRQEQRSNATLNEGNNNSDDDALSPQEEATCSTLATDAYNTKLWDRINQRKEQLSRRLEELQANRPIASLNTAPQPSSTEGRAIMPTLNAGPQAPMENPAITSTLNTGPQPSTATLNAGLQPSTSTLNAGLQPLTATTTPTLNTEPQPATTAMLNAGLQPSTATTTTPTLNTGPQPATTFTLNTGGPQPWTDDVAFASSSATEDAPAAEPPLLIAPEPRAANDLILATGDDVAAGLGRGNIEDESKSNEPSLSSNDSEPNEGHGYGGDDDDDEDDDEEDLAPPPTRAAIAVPAIRCTDCTGFMMSLRPFSCAGCRIRDLETKNRNQSMMIQERDETIRRLRAASQPTHARTGSDTSEEMYYL